MCALLPKIATRTRVVLFIHRYEDRKTTNTGRLATRCLTNSEVIVRGHQHVQDAPYQWDESTSPILLFPHEDAMPLAELVRGDRPITLLVPDGTWRQASKVRKRALGSSAVRCALLPEDAPSRYRLRAESREGGLATLEAIARALGVIEGAEVREKLEGVLRIMVDRSLWSRGLVSADDVAGGIPAGVMRHDPRSASTSKQ